MKIPIELKALVWMLFGIFFVFFTVIAMNEEQSPKKEKKKPAPLSFEMKKIVKPKARPKPKPKPKKSKPKPSKSSPRPNLSSSLGGIDTGLDSFVSEDASFGDDLLKGASKDVVMDENSVDEAPKPASRSALEYPKKARKNGVTGYVVMNILVSSSGRVEKVKVLESKPEGVFDDVAVSGVKSWEFKPAMYKGQAVKVWAKQKIRFDLN